MIFINNRTHVAEIGIFKCGFQIQVRGQESLTTGKLLKWWQQGGENVQGKKCVIHLFCFFFCQKLWYSHQRLNKHCLGYFSKIFLATEQKGNK